MTVVEPIDEQVLVALDTLLRGMSPANGYRYEWHVHREQTEARDEAKATQGKASCWVYVQATGFRAVDSEFVKEDLSVTIEARILHDDAGVSAQTVRARLKADLMKALGSQWVDGKTWGAITADMQPQDWTTIEPNSDNEVAGSMDLLFTFDVSTTDPTSQEHQS